MLDSTFLTASLLPHPLRLLALPIRVRWDGGVVDGSATDSNRRVDVKERRRALSAVASERP